MDTSYFSNPVPIGKTINVAPLSQLFLYFFCQFFLTVSVGNQSRQIGIFAF